MRLGVITDEVSQDFETALKFAKEFDLDCVELRSAYEKGPFDYETEDILKIKKLADEYGIPVTAISSPIFKCEYSQENIKLHTEKAAKIIEFAKILGATKIRCFDFFKDENVTHEMIKNAYTDIYAMCEKEGIMILIESEPTTNTNCCADIASLVKYVNKPYFKGLYDPGNNIYATDEIPFPDGYEKIKNCLEHIHIKDAVLVDGKADGVAVGEGLVDYKGLFTELKRIGYNKDVMLETHYRKAGKLSEATLKNPKGSAISENGYEASAECMENLKKILVSV